jgi:GTPase SAR1 family protein
LVCFSIDDPVSYENVIDKWILEIRQYYPSTPVILVGTKRDSRDNEATINDLILRNQRPILYHEGLKMKEAIGAKDYVECSSLDCHDIDRVFEFAARLALKKSSKKTSKRKFCTMS